MNTIVVLSTMRSGAMPDGEGAFIELETSEGMLELLHCADAAGWETTLDPVEQALKRFAGGNCRHELFVNSEQRVDRQAWPDDQPRLRDGQVLHRSQHRRNLKYRALAHQDITVECVSMRAKGGA